MRDGYTFYLIMIIPTTLIFVLFDSLIHTFCSIFVIVFIFVFVAFLRFLKFYKGQNNIKVVSTISSSRHSPRPIRELLRKCPDRGVMWQ